MHAYLGIADADVHADVQHSSCPAAPIAISSNAEPLVLQAHYARAVSWRHLFFSHILQLRTYKTIAENGLYLRCWLMTDARMNLGNSVAATQTRSGSTDSSQSHHVANQCAMPISAHLLLCWSCINDQISA
jgi:hypothetical protein